MCDFTNVELRCLRNANQMELQVTNYGAIITVIRVPDRDGQVADVTLGYNTLGDYINAFNKPYFGAVVGRYANRIANGRFTLDGREYSVPTNNGPNSLHGGYFGFDKVVWSVESATARSIRMSYVSADGEEGFPGALTTTVTYTLNDENELVVDYSANTDAPTILNLSQHAYFNLKGEGEGSIEDHVLTINADRFTPVNEALIPTGELSDVAGTSFDFRDDKPIGLDIDAVDEQLRIAGGYDHNWVLNRDRADASEIVSAAKVYEPASGRCLEVLTTEPGVQCYTGNFLDGSIVGKTGKPYQRRGAFCLETQHFPDSPNHDHFPSTVLRPDESFRSKTVFRFSTRDA